MANTQEMEDPILYVGKLGHELTEFVHENGDYLFMVFFVVCFFAIAWLLFRKRKFVPHNQPRLEHARLSGSCSPLPGCLRMLMAVALV